MTNPWKGEDQNPHESHFWAGIWFYGAIIALGVVLVVSRLVLMALDRIGLLMWVNK